MSIPTHSFYERLLDGRYRFRVDNLLINDFNTCDRYFMFRHMGQAVAGDATAKPVVWAAKTLNFKVALGQWWSSVMERLYDEMKNSGKLPSEHHVWAFATQAWTDHEMEQFLQSDPDTFHKFEGLDGARAMSLEYWDAFARQHFQSWRIIGTELGFGWSNDAQGRPEMYLGEDDKVVVYYGGKPDLVIVDMATNMLMPVDFKTKDSIDGNTSLLYKPHPQTAGYIWAVRNMLQKMLESGTELFKEVAPLPPTKCIVMVCARFRPTDKPRSGVRKPRFMPVFPAYSEAEIEEWRVSVIEKCRRLRDAIERDIWIPRESACHLFYHGCMFRRVCSTPPNMREQVLKADFIRVQPWQPYTVSEDN
jgi:hypothetical protein